MATETGTGHVRLDWRLTASLAPFLRSAMLHLDHRPRLCPALHSSYALLIRSLLSASPIIQVKRPLTALGPSPQAQGPQRARDALDLSSLNAMRIDVRR